MKKWQIGVLFATLYFMQGVVEPSDGLVSQPVRAMLRDWGRSPSQITSFVAWLSLPWAFKVGFGFLIDFVPLFGSRRRSYLLLTAGWCAVGMFALYVFPPLRQRSLPLLLWMIGINFAVASSDVATDALMVEVGQPAGLTGRLQSIQWTALFASGILSGYLGGYLSSPQRQTWGFVGCGVMGLIAFAGVLALIRTEPVLPPPPSLRVAVTTFTAACRSPQLLSVSVFLVVCSFNPFSQSLLYLHMTGPLKFSEVFYGQSIVYVSIASMLASAAYALYCQRLSGTQLGLLSISLGVVSTLAYRGLGTSTTSALIVTWIIGFTYQTASMAQFDLAARACPPAIAGTGFALFMALSNLSATVSVWVGGSLYERWLPQLGASGTFHRILYVGAAINLLAGLALPWLARTLPPAAPPINEAGQGVLLDAPRGDLRS